MGSTVLAISGALGGLVVFLGAVWAIIRAVLKQVGATEDNTTATKANTEAIGKLESRMSSVETTVTVQGEKLDNQGREIGQLRTAIYNGGRH